jgi:hypothetical protein
MTSGSRHFPGGAFAEIASLISLFLRIKANPGAEIVSFYGEATLR